MANHLSAARRRDTIGFSGRPVLRFTLAAVSALVLSMYCASFLDAVQLSLAGTSLGLSRGVLTAEGVLLTAKLLLPCVVVVTLLFANRSSVQWVIRHRYRIACVMLAVCVVMDVSGSSVAAYALFLGEEPCQGTLFGIPRLIRSDEWLVFTPLTIAQSVTGNQAISETIRASATDVTLSVGQPAWAIATLFRPFLWGYLVLGPSHGLSFFWVSRLIALILTSFELFKLLTDDDVLSFAGALMVGFSPAVQWWFAVNETAELFVFGQGLVLCLHRLLRSASRWSRWVLSLLLAWQAGCYLFVLYPAWQVPFFYIFAAMGVADFLMWVRDLRRQREYPCVTSTLRSIALPLAVSLVGIGLLVGISLLLAKDALLATIHASYPGDRLELGGQLLSYLSNIPLALATPIKAELYVNANVCEQACFVAFWPLGLVLGGSMAFRRRDGYLIGMVMVALFLWAFGLVGFPALLSRLTLMNHVTSGFAHERLQLPLGYLEVALLMRTLALRDGDDTSQPLGEARSGKRRTHVLRALVGAAVYAISLVVIGRHASPEILDKVQSMVVLVVYGFGAAACLLPASFFSGQFKRGELLLLAMPVVMACGLFVNPMQQGIDAITDSALSDAVTAIVSEDPQGQWLADNDVIGQLCVAAGARTINSIALYPDLDRWSTIDPDDTWLDIYNRHAHISARPAERTNFTLVGEVGNSFMVDLTLQDVKALGVDYWVSSYDLEEAYQEDPSLTVLTEVNGFTIYRVDTE